MSAWPPRRGRAPRTAGNVLVAAPRARTGSPGPRRWRRPGTAGRPRSRRRCRRRPAPGRRRARSRRPPRSSDGSGGRPAAAPAWARSVSRVRRSCPRPARSARASASMVSTPAAASLARWVSRIPATSSTSRCRSTCAAHAGAPPAGGVAGIAPAGGRRIGEAVVDQLLQPDAPLAVHRQDVAPAGGCWCCRRRAAGGRRRRSGCPAVAAGRCRRPAAAGR